MVQSSRRLTGLILAGALAVALGVAIGRLSKRDSVQDLAGTSAITAEVVEEVPTPGPPILPSPLPAAEAPTVAEEASAPKSARELTRLLNQAFIEVADEVSPAVVVIDVAQREEEEQLSPAHPWFDLLPEQWRDQLRRRPRSERGSSEQPPEFNGRGSGMIIDQEGRILTNHHVVAEAERIRVRLRDGREFAAELRGTDEQSDLAVLQLKEVPPDLPVVRLGDSDRVRVGEFAIAIGAPFRLDYTVTFGHVSAKGRHSVVPAMMGGALMEQDFIQTDASINPGNSGGPLVNIEGEVIGVNSMIRGLNSGIGFAIPINLAREISARLITDGRFVRSWLGVNIDALREMEMVRAKVPGVTDGVVVTRIIPNGPASEAQPELKPNDVIVAIDGKAVANPAELKSLVSRKAPGTPIALAIRREQESFVAQVTPQAMPEELTRPQNHRPSPPSIPRELSFLGMRIRQMSPSEADEQSVAGGALVIEVEEDSAAHRGGIEAGDVITEVNHRSLTTPLEFLEALAAAHESAEAGKGVVLVVRRDGKEFVPVLR